MSRHQVGDSVALIMHLDYGDTVTGWSEPETVYVDVDRVDKMGDGRDRYTGYLIRQVQWYNDDPEVRP